jgi:hypothetical protein
MFRSSRTFGSLALGASLFSLGCGIDGSLGVDTSLDVAALLAGGPPPASTSEEPVIFAADSRNHLVAFAESRPGQALYSAAISGMASGESIVGLDFRPSNGKLYGMSSHGRLYVFDQRGPSGTAVSATAIAELGHRAWLGFEFIPNSDRIRVHGENGLNLRLHPDFGVVVAVDAALRYVSGDIASSGGAVIVATAYTNGEYNGGSAPSSSVLFALDAANDALVTMTAPNDGQVRTVGRLGVDFTAHSSLDIAGSSQWALASLTTAANADASTLYRVDLGSGRAQAIGRIAGEGSIRAMALRR